MRLFDSDLYGFVLFLFSVTASITHSARLPRDMWVDCEFRSPHNPLRDVDTGLAPAVIATSDFLRRAYQACK